MPGLMRIPLSNGTIADNSGSGEVNRRPLLGPVPPEGGSKRAAAAGRHAQRGLSQVVYIRKHVSKWDVWSRTLHALNRILPFRFEREHVGKAFHDKPGVHRISLSCPPPP